MSDEFDGSRRPQDFLGSEAERIEFLMGMFDVLVHIGLALRFAGLVSSEKMVGAMVEIHKGIDLKCQSAGLPLNGPLQLARKLPAQMLGEVFAQVSDAASKPLETRLTGRKLH